MVVALNIAFAPNGLTSGQSCGILTLAHKKALTQQRIELQLFLL